MRPVEIIRCDGCGNRISDPYRAWKWEKIVQNQYMLIEIHPNHRCARAAEKKLNIKLR